VNLIPYLNGTNSAAPHDAIYLRMFDKGAFAVRSQDHKLVIPGKGSAPQLFDVTGDVSETKNLAEARPKVLQELEQRRAAWNSQLVEPVFEGLLSPKARQKARATAD
jgi:hypothetical protein